MDRVKFTNEVESELLASFTDWDECGSFGRQFYNAELRTNMGDFRAGDVVPCFVVDPEGGVIQILTNLGKLMFESRVRLLMV